MSQVAVQVITPVLTNFFHCLHCEQLFHHSGIGQQMHQEVLEQYPEDFKQDSDHLASWVIDLVQRYGEQIHIQVFDPQSLKGFFLSLRHWVRRYPTFIVNGRKAIVGSDQDGLERVLQASLVESTKSAATTSKGGLHDGAA